MKTQNVVFLFIVFIFVLGLFESIPFTDIIGFMGMDFDSAGPPVAQTESEQCVQDCFNGYCSAFNKESGSADMTQAEMQTNIVKYQACMSENQATCDENCGMVTEPDYDSMSDEQKCITDCVAKHDPDAICGNSQEGEVGNDVCQMCAQQCVHLYEGPCLDDDEITAKESVCYAQCEHCYGALVMGDAGQTDADGNTWDCIVDIECADASAEFGDDPGSGPASYEVGHEPSEDNVVPESFAPKSGGSFGEVFEGISEFFSSLFR